MSPSGNNNKAEAPKKPNITESVESLIAKKKAEKDSAGSKEVHESAAGIQSEVAEVMAGVEKPKEKISEREGESGEKGDIKAGSSGGGQVTFFDGFQNIVFPGEEVMIKKIRIAVEAQIKVEMKKAKKLRKNLTGGQAQEYNATISRIRKLKEVLASLVTATVDFVKGLYKRYFTPAGERRPLEEVDIK